MCVCVCVCVCVHGRCMHVSSCFVCKSVCDVCVRKENPFLCCLHTVSWIYSTYNHRSPLSKTLLAHSFSHRESSLSTTSQTRGPLTISQSGCRTLKWYVHRLYIDSGVQSAYYRTCVSTPYKEGVKFLLIHI